MRMKLFTGIFLLCFCSTIAQVRFANVIGQQTFRYGTIGNVVCKFDSAGQSVWAKDFSGKIISYSDSNDVMGSAFDGNYLFLLLMQGFNTNSQPSYGSVVMIDTLGNILFVKTSAVQSAGSYSLNNIYPSFNHGAWITENYGFGITRTAQAQFVDTNGLFGSLIDFWHGPSCFPVKILSMPDTSYIVCVNYYSTNFPVGAPTLAKLDKNGQVLWRKSYSTSLGGVNLEDWDATDITSDSSGVIYMFCNYWSDTTSGNVLIKFDNQGLPLLSMFCSVDFASNEYPNIIYSNGQIIVKLRTSEIVYDSLLNNACLGSQQITINYQNLNSSQTYPHSYSTETFTPANASSVQNTTVVLPDYCSVLASTGEINSNTQSITIDSYHDLISIESEYEDNELIISDILGRVRIHRSINRHFEIDCHDISDRIYFINVRNQKGSVSKIIMK